VKELEEQTQKKERLIVETRKLDNDVDILNQNLRHESTEKERITKANSRIESLLAKTNKFLAQEQEILNERIATMQQKRIEKGRVDEELEIEYDKKRTAESIKRKTESELNEVRYQEEMERLRNNQLKYDNANLELEANILGEEIVDEKVSGRAQIKSMEERHTKEISEIRKKGDKLKERLRETTRGWMIEQKSSEEVLAEEQNSLDRTILSKEASEHKERVSRSNLDTERSKRLEAEGVRRGLLRDVEKAKSFLDDVEKEKVEKERAKKRLEKKTEEAKAQVSQASLEIKAIEDEKESVEIEAERTKNLLALKEKKKRETALESDNLRFQAERLEEDQEEEKEYRAQKLKELQDKEESNVNSIKSQHQRETWKLQLEQNAILQETQGLESKLEEQQLENEKLKQSIGKNENELLQIQKQKDESDLKKQLLENELDDLELELKNAQTMIESGRLEAEVLRERRILAESKKKELERLKLQAEENERNREAVENAIKAGESRVLAAQRLLDKEVSKGKEEAESSLDKGVSELRAQRKLVEQQQKELLDKEEADHKKRLESIKAKEQKEKAKTTKSLRDLNEQAEELKKRLEKEKTDNERLKVKANKTTPQV